LDPLADKGLSIAVFSTFAALDVVPVWLVALIIARDIAIVAGATLMAARGNASAIRPLMVSKINTVVLIVLASWLLAAETFGWSVPLLKNALIAAVVALTAVSAAAYGSLLPRNVGNAKQKDGVN
ncbi:MAG: CDP-alcohol phosphatidyltransferase family protein, partial [Oricola sp.]